ncbi:hypothetical protein F4775DRAFT_555242 [Biscogniauxia sp. FL1348]|nr:hypothetical protein F4775DRAFT_555242 [Biscogniauxia sp. FL1348]
MMPLIKAFLLAAFTIATARAHYSCQGSPTMPNRDECEAAIRTINRDMQYSDQAQFSSGRCNIIYSTDRRGEQPVSYE